MIAIDSSVLIDLLSGNERAEQAEACLRQCLVVGPVVVCDVVLAELCTALKDGSETLPILENMSIHFNPMESKSALRAGEMQRRYRKNGGRRERTVPDFLVGAHALLQCNGLITRDGGFYRDYFKGLRVIEPQLA
ncbi:MAG: type II toxin-antitoxin system VapC family toxin [Pseudoxanthomonas sp.]